MTEWDVIAYRGTAKRSLVTELRGIDCAGERWYKH